MVVIALKIGQVIEIASLQFIIFTFLVGNSIKFSPVRIKCASLKELRVVFLS